MTSAARCSSASAYATSGTKNDASPAYASINSRTRLPRTARTRILASTTNALLGIPLLLADRPVDLPILVHQLVFRSAPGRDHFVQVLRGGAHRIELRLPATFLCGNVEAECLAVSRNRQRLVRFEVAREILAEFTDAILTLSILCTHCTH